MQADDEAHARDIAAYVGPLLIALAAALLLNRKVLPDLAQQLSHEYGLIFLSGALLFLGGLAIVRAHNVWSGGWRVIVTVLGWLGVVGGLMRILYFRHLAQLSGTVAAMPSVILFSALAMLFLGAFLTLKGYRLLD